uniref:HAT C-terminal dimerisation domain-containing protein n=1 Tax=Ciona savignyi TaxID=51511 RepID=H2YP29_CIOSA
YCDWRKGKQACDKHAASSHHKDCIESKIRNSTEEVNLISRVNRHVIEKQNLNYKALVTIFDAVLYLAKQGMALRGHTFAESNLFETMKLLSNHASHVEKWMNRETKYKFMNHEIQDEILKMCAHAILRQLVSEISKAKIFSLIVDETSDITRKEQLSICIRYLNSDYLPQEVFLGLYEVENTSADSLFQTIKAALLSSTDTNLSLRPLCPTRWDVCEDSTLDTATRGQARSHLFSLEAFSTYFMLRLMERVLINAKAFTSAVMDKAIELKLEEPTVRSQRRLPSTHRTAVEYYMAAYSSIFEQASSSLVERFDKKGFQFIEAIENLLCNDDTTTDDTKEKFPELDCANLLLEKHQFKLYKTVNKIQDNLAVDQVCEIFLKNDTLFLTYPNHAALIRQYLTLPSTSCAERSFSCLRRIKTYLRSTMRQERLNHLCLINVHSKRIQSLNKEKIINEFIGKNAVRQKTFK